MDKQQAQELIKETFESSFDESGFTNFIKNLLNRIDDAPFIYQGNYIPDAYKQYIKKLLGQIIFLYFLQKKGWFGVGRDDDWNTGSKHFLREMFEKKHGAVEYVKVFYLFMWIINS